MQNQAPLPPNPFTNRHMITREEDFVGRSREIRDILNRVRNGNSVSIVGERRIGKSSLIYHLFLTGNRRLNDAEAKQFKFIYLDFHDAQLKHPASFAGKVLQKMEMAYSESQLFEAPMVALGHYLEQHQQKNGPKPILLLDEFEEITQHEALSNDQFLEALRSFCNSGQLTLVTVSKNSLKSITDTHGLTSPFWNIFLKKELGEFQVDQQLDEVEAFIQKFWSDPIIITDKEKKQLEKFKTKHPLKLQVISYHLCENRSNQLPEKQVKKAIKKEMESYFRSGIEKRRKWIYRLPKGFQKVWAFILKPVKDAVEVYKSAKSSDK